LDILIKNITHEFKLSGKDATTALSFYNLKRKMRFILLQLLGTNM
jgi:hypothetical protein